MPDTSTPGAALEALQKENQRLLRAVNELSVLNDLSREISASLDSEAIMQSIVRRSIRAIDAEQGVITLVDEEQENPMKTLVRTMASSREQERFHFNQGLLGWMHLNKKPLLLNQPRQDRRFRGVKWENAIKSLVCVPLLVKSKLIGVLAVYNKKTGGGFSEDDQRLLSIIAGQSAQVIENARLYEEEKALMQMREELRLASKIQLDLLPKSKPEIAGYDVAGKTIPAQSVGGDYFDFISFDENRLAFCLGDVTGKGLPAAMLMANVQATIRSQTHTKASPKDCMTRASTLLFQSTDIEKFVTMFYGLLDFENHRLLYSNAGHNHPFVFSESDTTAELKTGGLMLGIMNDLTFEEESVELKPGDTLVIYSDGVTEAMGALEQEYGEERLVKIVKPNLKASAAELIEKIIDDVKTFAGDIEQSDDITVVVIKRNEA